MPKKDPRVDAYIAGAAEFARPALTHLRKLVHRTCPEVEESIKWKFPCFSYHGLMCGMAAFQSHFTFNLWKGALVTEKILPGHDRSGAMGDFGKMTSKKDLPPDSVIVACLEEAMRLNEEKVPAPHVKKGRAAAKALPVPEPLSAALKASAKAKKTWDALAVSHRNAYAEWIAEAKTEPTRDKRIAQAVGWLAEGKRRNWRYER